MTSQTLSSSSLPRSAPSRRNVLARLARWLIEADKRARDRDHLEGLPDRLRADAGLLPRSNAERALPNLVLWAMLMR